jgi:hypothetical protein
VRLALHDLRRLGGIEFLSRRRNRPPQFEAWLAGGKGKARATSEITHEMAVWNLALRIVYGHNHRGQLSKAQIEALKVERCSHDLVKGCLAWRIVAA